MKTSPKTIVRAIGLAGLAVLLCLVTVGNAINANPFMVATTPTATLALAQTATPTVPTFATVIAANTNPNSLTSTDFGQATSASAMVTAPNDGLPAPNIAITTVANGQSPPNAFISDQVNTANKIGEQEQLAAPAPTPNQKK